MDHYLLCVNALDGIRVHEAIYADNPSICVRLCGLWISIGKPPPLNTNDNHSLLTFLSQCTEIDWSTIKICLYVYANIAKNGSFHPHVRPQTRTTEISLHTIYENIHDNEPSEFELCGFYIKLIFLFRCSGSSKKPIAI